MISLSFESSFRGTCFGAEMACRILMSSSASVRPDTINGPAKISMTIIQMMVSIAVRMARTIPYAIAPSRLPTAPETVELDSARTLHKGMNSLPRGMDKEKMIAGL